MARADSALLVAASANRVPARSAVMSTNEKPVPPEVDLALGHLRHALFTEDHTQGQDRRDPGRVAWP